MSSRDVSPDSSTQPKQEHRKAKKRKQKHRSHKTKKKKKEEEEGKNPDPELVETESADSGSGKKKTKKRKQESLPAIDPTLEITIKPLEAYVGDRDELFKQLLSTVSKKDLKNMLPNILKKESLKEVKRLCLEHLRALSTKRLQKIISGQEMSPSDDEEPQQTDGNHQTTINTTAAPVAEEQDPPATPVAEQEKDAEIFEELITAPNQEEIDELVEGSTAEAELKQGVVDHNQDNTQTSVTNDVMSGTADEKSTPKEELELKELEFRARALKSLVQARERQMKLAVNSPCLGSS